MEKLERESPPIRIPAWLVLDGTRSEGNSIVTLPACPASSADDSIVVTEQHGETTGSAKKKNAAERRGERS